MQKIRKIIHIDMDAFFAAVEVKDNPSLKGKPIAVGGLPQERGVIATASYEARRFGVHSALASAIALKKCPNLILIHPNFARYKEESQAVFDIFSEYTDKVQPLSIDEAFLDVTDSLLHKGSATLIAMEILNRIQKERALSASAGISVNKFIAKVASGWKKPNGITTIPPNKIDEFMINLPVGQIYGVGKVTNKKMNDMGIFTCGELQLIEKDVLINNFGKAGYNYYDYCRGIDERPVEIDNIRKSVSVEHTFPTDINLEECIYEIPRLQGQLISRWEKYEDDYEIRSLFVKMKFYDFKQTSVENSDIVIMNYDNWQTLFEKAYNRGRKSIRLVGLGIGIEPRIGNT